MKLGLKITFAIILSLLLGFALGFAIHYTTPKYEKSSCSHELTVEEKDDKIIITQVPALDECKE